MCLDTYYMGQLRRAFLTPFTQTRTPGLDRENAMRQMKAIRRARPRILLYSHDTMGLGHLRRNLLIARALAGSELDASVLLATGSRVIGRFPIPSGVDVLVLPAFAKSALGTYRARHLDLDAHELARLRARLLTAAFEGYAPDLLLVDKAPRGVLGELDPVLTAARAGGTTRCILGLRDILDAPEAVRREWHEERHLATVLSSYDAVWVYGDPAVYDLGRHSGFGPEFRARLQFTGYLGPARIDEPVGAESASASAGPGYDADSGLTEIRPTPADQPFDLCLVGGGEDGHTLACAFVLSEPPPGVRSFLITGPLMPRTQIEALRALAAERPAVRLIEFTPEPQPLMRAARCLVTMGGYNTLNEALDLSCPLLVVPRTQPRREQLIRAQRLAELGLVRMLHPDGLTPESISRWRADPSRAQRSALRRIDRDGLARLPGLVARLLNEEEPRHARA
jgi:predicted glycosyltransferase